MLTLIEVEAKLIRAKQDVVIVAEALHEIEHQFGMCSKQMSHVMRLYGKLCKQAEELEKDWLAVQLIERALRETK